MGQITSLENTVARLEKLGRTTRRELSTVAAKTCSRAGHGKK
jgi:predicted metalloprotease